MTERITFTSGLGKGDGVGDSAPIVRTPRRELDAIDRAAEREGRAIASINSLRRSRGRRAIHHTKDSR